ncbi:MAG: nucleotidyl transferase AbiEii/AbiGii toxin family protein [Limnobacter sp.]|uniref:nucleotidyl transferase AbiEii/AbiGii toxin family protein n=1 Tax=Limnobacter sp. TaxID=2003368 RepID=UPI00391BDF3F
MKKAKATEIKAHEPLLDRIKTVALIAMVSNDELMDMLVLKGGNALHLVHKLSTRNSMDLDFSMEQDYFDGRIASIAGMLEQLLARHFAQIGLQVFDLELIKKPAQLPDPLKSFWGGYTLSYKLIEQDKFEGLKRDFDQLRRQAIRAEGKQIFEIDFSPFEYTTPKQAVLVENYTVYVYTPLMIVCEKLRAICQQTDEYGQVVGRQTKKSRPRDFYDIYYLVKKLNVDVISPLGLDIIKHMFAVKQVALEILGSLNSYRQLHAQNQTSLINTVRVDSEILPFDEYFDFVNNLAREVLATIKEQSQVRLIP